MKITAHNLVKAYRGRRVVNGISIEVGEGEIVGLLGPNGAGKTTTFYMIVGLVRPQSGQVLLNAQDITRLPMYKRARAGISYLPQEASVFRNLTVEENLRLVLQMQKLSPALRRERAESLMEELHITHRRHDLGKTLSGGERRRVEIARALAANPRFILLDEPFTGVDPKAIEDIETIIQRLSKESKIGILITDHNVEAMLRITERAYIVAEGEKRFEGDSEGLLENSEARAYYFGERYGRGRSDSSRDDAEAELLGGADAPRSEDGPMRLIDKLVLKDLIGPFLNGLLMFLMLLFAAAYLFPATELIVKGVPFAIVANLTLLFLPSLVTQTFPMAMLLGGLLAFGRLSSDREAVAIFAAGVSFPRAIRAVWIMGAAVSVLAFFWNDLVVPPAMTAYWNLQQASLKKMMPSNQPLSYAIPGPEGHGYSENVTASGGFDAQSRTLRRVTIVKYTDKGERRGSPEALIYCDRAEAHDDRGLAWKYCDGYFDTYSADTQNQAAEDSIRIYFKELNTLPAKASIGKSFDEVIHTEITDPNRKSFRELRDEINADRARGEEARGKEVDLYGKIALPLASLIFGVMGASLGLNTQRGGGKSVGFGMAIFIVFLYWIFYHSMFVVGKSGAMPPIVASFLADIVGAIAVLILAARASR